MSKLQIRPQKKWGQHFLIHPEGIEQMISQVQAFKPALVVEVGPGLGALTEPLQVLKLPLLLVERDPVLCQYWKDKGLPVWPGDVLHFTQSPEVRKLKPPSLLLGNLPYRIASRLLVQWCPGPGQVQFMILMFQTEVAERIKSPAGLKAYGLLSVLAQTFWKVTSLLKVERQDFYPAPEVGGEVLVFEKKPCTLSEPELFLRFMKLCFQGRRKFLIPRLKKALGPEVEGVYKGMGWSPTLRPGELSPEDYLSFFHHITQKGKGVLLV